MSASRTWAGWYGPHPPTEPQLPATRSFGDPKLQNKPGEEVGGSRNGGASSAPVQRLLLAGLGDRPPGLLSLLLRGGVRLPAGLLHERHQPRHPAVPGQCWHCWGVLVPVPSLSPCAEAAPRGPAEPKRWAQHIPSRKASLPVFPNPLHIATHALISGIS